MRLTLTGKLDMEGERLVLTIEDVTPGPQKLIVGRGESTKEKEAKDFSYAFTQAQGLAGKTVEIEGLWKPAEKKKGKKALPSLTVTRISEFKPASAPTEQSP